MQLEQITMRELIIISTFLSILSSCRTIDDSCDCNELVMNDQELWTLDEKPYTGKCISYYQNGVKESEADFKKGQVNGHMLSFYSNGNLEEDSKWINGKMIDTVVNYYETGQLSVLTVEVDVTNGKNSGYARYFYKSGILSEEGRIKDNKKEGVWKVYHENGKLMSFENWKNDLQVDSSYGYYENGQLQMKGNFLEGKFEGKWTFYDSLTGEISGYLLYEDGIVNKKKSKKLTKIIN